MHQPRHFLQSRSFPLVKPGLLLGHAFQVIGRVAEAGNSSLLLERRQVLLKIAFPGPQNLATRVKIENLAGANLNLKKRTSPVRAKTPDSARSSDNSARFSL